MPWQFQVFWALVTSSLGQLVEDFYTTYAVGELKFVTKSLSRAIQGQLSSGQLITFLFECIVLVPLLYATETA